MVKNLKKKGEANLTRKRHFGQEVLKLRHALLESKMLKAFRTEFLM